jgi:hypothetical protein
MDKKVEHVQNTGTVEPVLLDYSTGKPKVAALPAGN